MEAEPRFLPAGAPDAQPKTHGPAVLHELRTCRIERWRGYLTSRFYVLTVDEAVLESRPFRWRHAPPPPETQRARAAYEELVSRLEEEGWTRFENGPHWYATMFARAVAVPVAAALRAPPPSPAPAPVVTVVPPSISETDGDAEEPVAEAAQEAETIADQPPSPAPAPLVSPSTSEADGHAEEPVAAAAPEAEAIAETAAGAEPPPSRRRSWRGAAVISISIAAIAGVASALLLGVGHPGSRTGDQVRAGTPATPPSSAAQAPTRAALQGARAPVRPSSAPPLVHVRIAAHGSGSWIEARRGSKSGRVLYQGVLVGGKRLHFVDRRVWLQVGAAGNLSIVSDGKPIVLRGTFERVLRPSSRSS